MLNSIWTENVQLPRFPRLEGSHKTDVLIIGGGLAGILCAYKLQQAGIAYMLIEADTICAGVTRNTTAKITSQHGLIYDKLLRTFDADTARLYWQANEQALAAYRQLAESVDCDFETKSNYVYTTHAPQKLERELQALQQLGIPAKFVRELPLPMATKGAVCFEDQAQFHPLKFVSHIAKGLHIYTHTAALSFEKNTVRTAHGSIRASKIILATHFPINNKHGFYFAKLYQQRSYVLALADAGNVDGMYLEENGLSLRNAGQLLLVGGGGHRTGKPGGGWEQLTDFAKQYYPAAREQCRWATQDCMSLDGVPYIGQYSTGTPDLYVATGFQKWGMTSSMVAAAVLCDLVRGRENPYAQVFSPSRSILHPQLLKNVLETSAGLLTFRKPRCPHLGCALKWNPQERSWDCPCHGSRFSEDGTLLDNPATGDLEKTD